ncbi:MAG: DUF4142 domain-containing protein [Terriglobales bacterium]
MDTFERIICRVAFGLLFSGFLLSVAVSQGGARAVSPAAQSGWAQASTKLSAVDQQFLEKAADGSLAEVELGKLAVQKASSQEVKDFGQRMIDEHGRANDQLKRIAANKDVELPQTPGGENKAMKDRLARLSGEQFDHAYMAVMLKHHRQDIAEFRHESKAARDTDVKNFATKTLPTLQRHLKQGESIALDLKAQQHPNKKPSPAIAQSDPSRVASRSIARPR